MKTTLAKTLPIALFAAAASLWLAPAGGFAQSTESATAPVYPVVHVFSGNFKSTDGNSGTYLETVTTASATVKSETTVFTRASDKATSTEKTSTVINADGTRTVDYTATGYNATAAFTSHKVLSKETHGQFFSQGTFTNAAGVSGTLTTLETKAETVSVVSAVYNASTGITNDLRIVDSGFGFTIVKSLSLDPAGKLTTTVNTRYVTSSK